MLHAGGEASKLGKQSRLTSFVAAEFLREWEAAKDAMDSCGTSRAVVEESFAFGNGPKCKIITHLVVEAVREDRKILIFVRTHLILDAQVTRLQAPVKMLSYAKA
jgi:hypothetical protein